MQGFGQPGWCLHFEGVHEVAYLGEAVLEFSYVELDSANCSNLAPFLFVESSYILVVDIFVFAPHADLFKTMKRDGQRLCRTTKSLADVNASVDVLTSEKTALVVAHFNMYLA